ncbi:MAG: CPBP family intramembrane metalloprotease [Marinilabiliales bacterium]|nr:CPBP family intramembrane metalloprotease [Marinilabiliales bacterium]
MEKRGSTLIRTLVSFAVLFGLYHLAEYGIVRQNSAVQFFLFQFLFFGSAWFLGNWNGGKGWSHWGLGLGQFRWSHLLVGILPGILLYAVPYCLALLTGWERIGEMPAWTQILSNGWTFVSGLLFSSFSEDLLTRGTVYSLLQGKVRPVILLSLSALVYLLNHIYRLQEGWETWSYLFLLGIVLMLPVLRTGNLWLTGFLHWSGNSFFFVSHSLIPLSSHPGPLTSNQLFSVWMVLYLPLLYFALKKLKLGPEPTHKGQLATKEVVF